MVVDVLGSHKLTDVLHGVGYERSNRFLENCGNDVLA